mmetsp:Transcript_10095/g.29356  ORF Transcript_10095/g.29356 Transcript_10095/m.29356 type:complete len:218 (-) Transcript_10095:7-660(-)
MPSRSSCPSSPASLDVGSASSGRCTCSCTSTRRAAAPPRLSASLPRRRSTACSSWPPRCRSAAPRPGLSSCAQRATAAASPCEEGGELNMAHDLSHVGIASDSLHVGGFLWSTRPGEADDRLCPSASPQGMGAASASCNRDAALRLRCTVAWVGICRIHVAAGLRSGFECMRHAYIFSARARAMWREAGLPMGASPYGRSLRNMAGGRVANGRLLAM